MDPSMISREKEIRPRIPEVAEISAHGSQRCNHVNLTIVPRCRLFNIGPKIGPPSGPPFLLVDLIWTRPAPPSKILDPPLFCKPPVKLRAPCGQAYMGLILTRPSYSRPITPKSRIR